MEKNGEVNDIIVAYGVVIHATWGIKWFFSDFLKNNWNAKLFNSITMELPWNSTAVNRALAKFHFLLPFSFLPLLLLLLLSRFSRVRLCMTPPRVDGSPPGSPVPGILQARTLEWVAISFSNAWKWKVKVKSLSRVRLPETPWTAAYQASTPILTQIDKSGIFWLLPSLYGHLCIKILFQRTNAFTFRLLSKIPFKYGAINPR